MSDWERLAEAIENLKRAMLEAMLEDWAKLCRVFHKLRKLLRPDPPMHPCKALQCVYFNDYAVGGVIRCPGINAYVSFEDCRVWQRRFNPKQPHSVIFGHRENEAA